jgi:ubiquinone biosynthesis protein UbiJ
VGAEDVFRYVLLSAVVIVPALGITARFALKPVVDAVVRLREAMAEQDSTALARALAAELAELRAETATLRDEVARLSTIESFHRQLQQPNAGELPPSSVRPSTPSPAP